MKCDSTIENGKSIIHLFYRKADGTRCHIIDRNYRSNFFISAEEAASKSNLSVSTFYEEPKRGMIVGNPDGIPLVRVESDISADVPRLIAGYQTSWEGKVFFNHRYLIDKVPKCLDESLPIRDVIDIEMAFLNGAYILTNIGFYCYSENKYYEYYQQGCYVHHNSSDFSCGKLESY